MDEREGNIYTNSENNIDFDYEPLQINAIAIIDANMNNSWFLKHKHTKIFI